MKPTANNLKAAIVGAVLSIIAVAFLRFADLGTLESIAYWAGVATFWVGVAMGGAALGLGVSALAKQFRR